KRFIDILCHLTGGHHKLRRYLTHHCSQDRVKQKSTEERMEKRFGQVYENRYGKFLRGIKFQHGIRVKQLEVGNPEKTEEQGAQNSSDHPGHAHRSGFFNVLYAIDRHKADEDMRLTEIPQSPGQ